MSHFAVMVIGENPEEQLAPYDENIEVPQYCAEEISEEEINEIRGYYDTNSRGHCTFDVFAWEEYHYMRDENGVWHYYSRYNPKSKWDWYLLGGRWSGCFIKLKPKSIGIKGHSHGYFEVRDERAGIDAAYKKDIDFDAIFDSAEKEARKTYRDISSLFAGGIPQITPWTTYLDGEQYAGLSIEEKRTLYNQQQGVKLWRETIHANSMYVAGYDQEEFLCTEDEYAMKAKAFAFIPFAVLKDGEWYEKGKMGWWGMVKDAIDDNEWAAKVMEMVNELPDDTLISFYDCHI